MNTAAITTPTAIADRQVGLRFAGRCAPDGPVTERLLVAAAAASGAPVRWPAGDRQTDRCRS